MAQRKATDDHPPGRSKFPMDVVLAVNLRHDRDAAGLSQGELGVYSGTSKNTVALIEAARLPGRGNSTTTDTIQALAVALDEPWIKLVTPRAGLASEYDAATRVYLHGKAPLRLLVTA